MKENPVPPTEVDGEAIVFLQKTDTSYIDDVPQLLTEDSAVGLP